MTMTPEEIEGARAVVAIAEENYHELLILRKVLAKIRIAFYNDTNKGAPQRVADIRDALHEWESLYLEAK